MWYPVGVDRPDADGPLERDGGRVELPDASAEVRHRDAVAGEVRDLAAYHADLRAAVAVEYEGTRETRADGKAWQGDGNRYLDGLSNAVVDHGCERIREVEGRVLSPVLRRVEAEDPGRELAGFEHRIKGADRIKEKVADQLRAQPGLAAEHALAGVSDAVRYTFRYGEGNYAAGVRADIDRLQARGFELVKMRNSWASDQYRGVNSQWQEPGTGQRFEVQFHTQASLDAKQQTHAAYEQLRNPLTTRAEQRRLEEYQRKVSGDIPAPPGAAEIPDYP